MEDSSGGKLLSDAEKEKLKEKLAFLKREYSKTLARLQRAQRAEKLKNSSKKIVGEHDCLFQQEILSQLNFSEPKNTVSPCDPLQTNTVLDEETGERTSVALDDEPESLTPDNGPVEEFYLQRTDVNQEHFFYRDSVLDAEKTQGKLPGRKQQQQKRTLTSQEGQAIFDAESFVLSEGRLKGQEEINRENPSTPVSEKITYLLTPKYDIPDCPAALTEADKEGVFMSSTAKPQLALLKGNPSPRVTSLSLHSPLDSSDQHNLSKGNCELAAQSVLKNMTIFKDIPEINKGEYTNNQMSRCLHLETGSLPSVNENTYDNLLACENQNLSEHHTMASVESPSNSLKYRNENLEEQMVGSQSESVSPERTAPVSAENQAHSCTVIEGLLFPAEYYVRTTRHMSDSQRKVALEAVIQNHLGARKKNLRNKKEATKNVSVASEETEHSGTGILGPGMDQSNSNRPQIFRSLNLVRSTLGSAEDGLSRKLVSQPLGGKHRGKRKEVCGQKEDSLYPRNAYLPLDNDAFKKSGTPFFRNEKQIFKHLSSFLKVRDFELPDADFGLLKLGKLMSGPKKPGEPFESKYQERHLNRKEENGVALEEHTPKQVEMEDLEEEIIPPRNAQHKLSNPKTQPKQRDLSSSIVLFTPVNTTVLDDSDRPTISLRSPTFPILGTTPALCSPEYCEKLSTDSDSMQRSCTPCLSPTNTISSLYEDGQQYTRQTSSQNLGSNMGGSGWKGRPACDPDSQAVLTVCEENPLRNLYQESQAQSTEQTELGGLPSYDNLNPGSLQLVSKLKHPSGSCSVDVSAVWWEIAGVKEPCIITACEYLVSLWRPLDTLQWEKIYSWHFTEVPILQIVPVPGVCSLVCVALGNLEIREIRALLYSLDGTSEKQTLLISGNIKAVLGLAERRLVSSCGTHCDQQVEVMTFSEDGGSKEKQFLMSPEETILTFAEVKGMPEALLGSTIMNNIVIWNLRTGQLLKKMSIGDAYQASVCHKAYAEMGLLFIVLSHPCAKESERMGSPVFQLIVINPKTTLNIGVMLYCLPQGQVGRFLEGDVKDNFAAAVLTSGKIAIWDLLLGHCTALLPPLSDQNWSFVKWSGTDSHLLAGQKDGNIFVYRY